jgi:hypothetical protein
VWEDQSGSMGILNKSGKKLKKCWSQDASCLEEKGIIAENCLKEENRDKFFYKSCGKFKIKQEKEENSSIKAAVNTKIKGTVSKDNK